eukprot:UN05581
MLGVWVKQQPKSIRDRLFIHTKAHPTFKPFTKDGLKTQLESSSNFLGDDVAINAYYLHTPDMNTPLPETLEALESLRKDNVKNGKFSTLGFSNFSAWETSRLIENTDYDHYVTQGMYNAITREVEKELLWCCQAYKNSSFIAYKRLGRGLT